MATNKSQHIHKFKRLKYRSGNQIFFCALPDCTVKLNPALALGKRSLCWRCEEPFEMTEYSLRLAKPHCENCHKPKNPELRGNEVFRNPELSDTTVTLSNKSLSERLQNVVNNTLPAEIEDEL